MMTNQLEKLVVVTIWSTSRLDTKLIALPPVGEELLVKVQFSKEATFTTASASSGTKLSYIRVEERNKHAVYSKLTDSIFVK